MLFWHEGQMRALIGETDQAIEFFLKSKRTPDWDAYVDATVAFLRNDRPTLETARASLLAAANGSSSPPNLNVVDGFLKCFGQTYEQVYGNMQCMKPASRN